MTGDLLDRGASRCDPKRGQLEVAGEFSVSDSEGRVFEAACGGDPGGTSEFDTKRRSRFSAFQVP